jgi:uncharacterized protein YndB with AHSA1/START domain
MATVKAAVEAEMDVSPGNAFAVLTDPTRMASWLNGVQAGGWIDGQHLEPGGRFMLSYRYARQVSDITMEVVSAVPGSRFEFRTVEGPYPIHATFEIASAGAGARVVYRQVAFSDSFLSALGFWVTGWFAKRMVKRVLARDLAKLAEQAGQGR